MPKDLSIDKPLDKHLKPVKDSDGTMSALELSTGKVRVKDLQVTGTTSGVNDGTKLPLVGGTMTGDITIASSDAIRFGHNDEFVSDS